MNPESVGRSSLQEGDIIPGVEGREIRGRGGPGAVTVHLVMKSITQDQGVGHADPVGLHGVAWPVVEAADVRVVEVGDLRGGSGGRGF